MTSAVARDVARALAKENVADGACDLEERLEFLEEWLEELPGVMLWGIEKWEGEEVSDVVVLGAGGSIDHALGGWGENIIAGWVKGSPMTEAVEESVIEWAVE